ncbi:unannotated protein [freshwater metagenome]|uniref:Unannotated protein n=1 Tax=freshwater metagenome TaxID=449393 RepID=A0A6J7H0P1_9ZZZZ
MDARADHVVDLQLGLDRCDDGVEIGQLILADVDHGEHRLVREQEHRLEQLALLGSELAAVHGHATLQGVDGGFERRHLVEDRLVARLGHAAPLVELLLGAVEVADGELNLEDAERIERIGRAGHVVVRERP